MMRLSDLFIFVMLAANEPIDGYWQRVYEVVRVNQVPYTIESYVDGQILRPYFNTHCFSINPAKGIFGSLASNFCYITDG